MFSNDRVLMNCLCGKKVKGRNRKEVMEYPAIDCVLNCKHCGFNPIEADRRIRTGSFIQINGIRTLHFNRAD